MTAASRRALDLHQPPEGWQPAAGMPDNLRTEDSAFLTHMRASLLSDDWPYAVKAFRRLMLLPLPETPTPFEPLAKQLHASLLQEELAEFAAADGLIEQVDGLIDLIYVAVGALLHLGLTPNQIHQAFSEVQCSNMTKVMDNGKPLINDGVIDPSKPIGKVLKTNNYVQADIGAAIGLTPDPEPTEGEE